MTGGDEIGLGGPSGGDEGDRPAAVDFSVVVPVYNGANSLEELYRRLAETFGSMGRSFEVIFVDDGSKDESLSVLRSLHDANPETVRVISLYRNQGQQVALMCGFRFCTGEVVVTIDDDLQQSPEDIPALYAELQQGHDAVIGFYRKKAHRRLQNVGSAVVRWLNRRIFQTPPEFRLSSYRLIRRDLVRHLLAFRTSFPYISGMILSTTHRVGNVEVAHEPRRHGRSGYTLPKLIKLSYNLLINYSAFPLRVIGYVGMVASVMAFVTGGVFIVRQMLTDGAPQGWTSLVVLLSLFCGILFAMLFVMAEYVSRLLTEVADRPGYAIREVLE